MANPLGAISAINSAATNPTSQLSSATFSGETFSAQSLASGAQTSTPASGLSSSFQTFMESFQSSGAGFEGSVKTGAAHDPVAAARADMAGSGTDARSVVLAPSTPSATDAAAPKNPGTEVLQKSFDHAVFVSLVSQIVSGVSQATSTLVRQQ